MGKLRGPHFYELYILGAAVIMISLAIFYPKDYLIPLMGGIFAAVWLWNEMSDKSTAT